MPSSLLTGLEDFGLDASRLLAVIVAVAFVVFTLSLASAVTESGSGPKNRGAFCRD